jgi:amino acid adenylation domain-containing protein
MQTNKMEDGKRAIAERFAQLPKDKQRVFLEALRAQGLDFASLPIVPATAPGRAALSYAQARQWFLWHLAPDSTAYHIAGALRMKGALDETALRSAFAALVARHEALRTVFRTGPGGAVEQVVLPQAEAGITFTDLAEPDADGGITPQLEERLQQAARRIGDTPFDLEHGPLLRLGLIRLHPHEHVLVLVMHHIVSDAWSMQIIVREFVALYRALPQGNSSQAGLAALPIQYADYAAWQRNWLEAGEKARQLQYWKGRLGRAHPVLQLATDHPRRTDGHYRAARHDVLLPRDLVQQLQQQAQAHGATLFMALLAGLQALLHRHSGLCDIRVGVPVANRQRPETQGLVGFFVNTQVLDNALHGRLPLAQVLAQAREAALGAQAHQDLPFEQLVEALQPERELGRSPLFQVMFNHLRENAGLLDQLPGLGIEEYPLGGQAAQFELALSTLERADGSVQAGFVYAAELFEPATIERLAGHYVALLHALAAQPGMALGDVDLLAPAERGQLALWGDAPATPGTQLDPQGEPVHRLFEHHARTRPDATALLFDDQALSYADLNARANRLAHRLVALGVRPESRVGVAAERSVEMIVALLAVLKAGAAYVPLDPELPPGRLAYMAADSGIALLLAQGGLMPLLQPLTASAPALPVLLLEEAATRDTDTEIDIDANPAVPLHAEHLAYVVYTSGSTGRPKGAAVRHGSLSLCMRWMQHTYALAQTDTVLHKAPFGFDVSVWEIFWPLSCGARLVLARPGDQRDPARIVHLIRQHQVTTLNFVPAMLQAFLAHPGIEAHTRLRHVICGGEAMPSATQREALQRLQGVTLQNLYGPTETTIHVTQWTCRDDGRALVPIGRPIAGVVARVLDAGLNLLPAGVPGELYLGGALLGRGYLHRPGLTAERFVADPFDPAGGRLYRTGDLVRWNAEGQLEYLGRIDHQVKIRGLRIELGEVEATLLAQPGLREAVVVARDGPAGAPIGTRLVAYVSALPGHAVDAHALRQQLALSLPDYMVPGAFVALPALPLNANGKVDRNALPEPEMASGGGSYAAPQGQVEQALAALWADVLGVPQVGRHDDFFELGGHSLLTLTLLQRLQQQPGGADVSLATLFRHRRLADQALAIQPAPAVRAQAGDDVDAIVQSAGGEGVPLYCFPGLVVNGSEYREMVAALAGERPVHGFVSHALTARRWDGEPMDRLAARYAAYIRRTAASGACALLGWSLGGDIAFETARQLAGDVDVVFLGLVDVMQRQEPPPQPLTRKQRAFAAARMDRWFARSAMRPQWQQLIERLDPALRDAVAAEVLGGAEPPPLDGPAYESQEYLRWAILDARRLLGGYRHGRTAAPLHVWTADAALRQAGMSPRDWSTHGRVVSQHTLAGTDHFTIVRAAPFVAGVRHTLQEADALARRRGEPPAAGPAPRAAPAAEGRDQPVPETHA